MLTPKHRALFAAAYSSILLRRSDDDAQETEAPAAEEPGEGSDQPKGERRKAS